MGTFLPAKREVSRMRRRRQRGVAAILLTIATLALFLTAAVVSLQLRRWR